MVRSRTTIVAAIGQTLSGVTLACLLAGCLEVAKARPANRVELVPPSAIISSDRVSGYLTRRFINLSNIDPNRPLEADLTQTLSLFGREDLIAPTSNDYQSTDCPSIETAATVTDEIERRARKTSIVIINESHERSEHRGFIAEIAGRLRPLGYDTLAIETLANNAPDLAEEFRSPFLRQPMLPYFSDDDGFYLSESGFGRLGRQAKALGYRLVPYEIYPGAPAPNATRLEQIAVREEAQANNLAAFLQSRPGTKLLVHVGYSHANEVPQPDGATWMAARLKQKTGIDPLTISQTLCRGGGTTTRLAMLPATSPVGTVDLVVDHPVAQFVRGRPQWRLAAGDRVVSIPKALQPKTGWRVIEARPVGEPSSSVPMDRVAIRPGEDIALMLPPGRYDLRAIDVKPAAPMPATSRRPSLSDVHRRAAAPSISSPPIWPYFRAPTSGPGQLAKARTHSPTNAPPGMNSTSAHHSE